MHVTSNYYRCRAQRAAFAAESLTLLGEAPAPYCPAPVTAAQAPRPLSPSLRTLRSLADLHKPETYHRVA